FILSSVKETFGVVVIEALSMGLPVLASNCGGPEELIEDGVNGFIYDQLKQIDFETKLRQSYENYSFFNLQSIIESTDQKFNNNVFFDKLIKIYSSILK
ncbi:MAG TPA: glycosyltransferase, partial [Flavobacterium sp.]|nr:glycosyltransferase [Flavobacterium sp.]